MSKYTTPQQITGPGQNISSFEKGFILGAGSIFLLHLFLFLIIPA